MKASDQLLLADGNLRCGMYPAGKVAISRQPLNLIKYNLLSTLNMYHSTLDALGQNSTTIPPKNRNSNSTIDNILDILTAEIVIM